MFSGLGPTRVVWSDRLGEKLVNLGIIGCGRHAETAHLPVLQRLGGVRLQAACDTRDERLRLVDRVFHIRRLYHDWAGVMVDPDVDAVLIATTGDSHAELAGAALAAGKHVLVEKPLALTVADAEVLAEKARGASAVSMIGFNFRFHPVARELKAAIERGAVGRPLAVYTTALSARGQALTVTGYQTSPAHGGGVFHDSLVHSIDLLRFLFDCEVVSGRATAHSQGHRHNAASVDMLLANGVHVSGYSSKQALPDMSLLVIGDEGKATVNFSRPAGVALYRREFSRSRVAKLLAYARQAPRLASAIRLATPVGRLSSYRNEWQHFLACIGSGNRAKPDFDDGLAVTRVVAQLIASLNNPADDGSGVAPPGLPGEPARGVG